MPKSNLPVPAGSPKKSGKRDRAPIRLLPVLEVDLTKDPADLILPCSEARQANFLGWYAAEVRSINRILGHYDKLPMRCAAENCHWAKLCPTGPDFMFRDLRCPLEIMEIFRLFVRYVQEMEVTPDRHVDLTQIMDLIRIDLQMHRVDQELQVAGLTSMEGYAVHQITGEEKKRKVVHPLLSLQKTLRSDRDALYKQLLASRRDIHNIRVQEGKKTTDAMQMLAELMKMSKNVGQAGGGELVQIEDSPKERLRLPLYEPEEETMEAEVLPNFSAFSPKGE